MAQRKTCFVMCPIGKEGTETRLRSDEVFEFIIKKALDECGYETVRSDQISGVGLITVKIVEQLYKSDLLVADLTDRDPNVFYEVGIGHALRKPCVLIAYNGTGIPFDLAQFRTVMYDYGTLTAADQAKAALVEAVKAAEKQDHKLPAVVDQVETDLVRAAEVVERVSDSEWKSYRAAIDDAIWEIFYELALVGMVAAIALAFLWLNSGLTGIQLVASLLLIAISIQITRYAGLKQKKNYAGLVVGLVANTTGLTRISDAARMVGLNAVDFSRLLAELISAKVVVNLEIYPEVGCFGSPGKTALQVPIETSKPLTRSKRDWYTLLRWFGISGGVLTTLYWALQFANWTLQWFFSP